MNEEDMIVLAKAAILGCNMTLNLGAILLFYLDRQAVQTRGPIVCGGVATVLANTLNVPIGNLQPLAGEHISLIFVLLELVTWFLGSMV